MKGNVPVRIMHTPEGAWLNANDIRRAYEDDTNIENALKLMKVGADKRDDPKKILKIAGTFPIVDALAEANATPPPTNN